MDGLPRRLLFRGVSALLVVALLCTTVGLTLAYEPPELGAVTIEETADSRTAVAVQGFHFQGEGDRKKPARLLLVNQSGNVTELQNGTDSTTTWFYDVDPLDDGNLLVTSTVPGDTIVYELDPETNERVWEQQFDAEDTHDVDMLNEHELLVANMRNPAENGTSNDRLFIYNLTSDEVVWEWYFRHHYPADTDGGYSEDWSHVNDVDKIEEGRYLVSPRNFDQVIVVNRSTKEIELQLGEDDNHDVLFEQHNPDYLEGPDGTPTILVADSENDRVVEYARTDGEWELVWELGLDQFNWPRDADRLPNGNTLITDSLNHRVVEVTPRGEIVWEVRTPWGPYDAERVRWGDGSNGPTMQELGVDGSYELTDAAGNATNATTGNATDGNASSRTATDPNASGASGSRRLGSDPVTFPEWLQRTFGDTPVAGPVDGFAETWEGISQWVKPVWMAPWGFVTLVAAVCLTVVWALVELVVARHRIYRVVSSSRPR
jgi:hypothetical protein